MRLIKMNFKFDHPDWFSHNIPNWNKIKSLLPSRDYFLEIGSFEGRSTVWIAENLAEKSTELHCIDTWDGGPEYEDSIDHSKVEENFYHNTSIVSKNTGVQILPWKGFSQEILQKDAEFLSYLPYDGFDLIYIDGSHVAKDVLTDACLSWNLLKTGGIMIFDDFGWTLLPEEHLRPALAINSFLACFKNEYKELWKGYQVGIQKL